MAGSKGTEVSTRKPRSPRGGASSPLVSPGQDGASVVPGGDDTDAPAPLWMRFDGSLIGSEEDFEIRSGDTTAIVRFNGHRQIIAADSRRLVSWEPEEMRLIAPRVRPS